jgi:XisI protein
MVRKLKKYENAILSILNEYLESRKNHPVFEYQLITDTQHKHYQIVRTGWDDTLFIHQIILHFQIKEDGKIWIWVNKTEVEVDVALNNQGILNSDIVIGFQSKMMRELSGYALA